jgi:hypothetical protein
MYIACQQLVVFPSWVSFTFRDVSCCSIDPHAKAAAAASCVTLSHVEAAYGGELAEEQRVNAPSSASDRHDGVVDG